MVSQVFPGGGNCGFLFPLSATAVARYGGGLRVDERGKEVQLKYPQTRPQSSFLPGPSARGSRRRLLRGSVELAREPRVLLRKKPADKTGPPVGVRC